MLFSRTGNVHKEMLQQLGFLLQEPNCFITVKRVRSGIIVTTDEQTVDDGLRIHIRKFSCIHQRAKVRFDATVKTIQFRKHGQLLLCVINKGLSGTVIFKNASNNAANCAGVHRHVFGEFTGRSNLRRVSQQEIFHQTDKQLDVFFFQYKLSVNQFNQLQAGIHLGITSAPKTPFQIISKNCIAIPICFGLNLRQCPLVNTSNLLNLNTGKRFCFRYFFLTMPQFDVNVFSCLTFTLAR